MREATTLGDPAFWAEVSRRLEADLGLHFVPRQWSDMRRGLALAAQKLGLPDAASCGACLLSLALDARQRDLVAQCLTIGETYFFRDPAVFEALGREVLLPLTQARRGGTKHLRLWSAGCSTGEEPYSLAMLVATLLPDWRDWNITILATDLNSVSLEKAASGVYGGWSFRGGVPAAARSFIRPAADGRQEVDPELRRLVQFAPLNFAQDAYPSRTNGTNAIDLILCRNVLIYFETARAQTVLRRLGSCLTDGGWLVTGSVEFPSQPIPGLDRERLGPLAALRRPSAVSAVRRVAAPIPPPAFVPARLHGAAPLAMPIPQLETVRPAANDNLAPRARALADAGELDAAERLCRDAMAADKLDAQWPWLLASILAEQGRTRDAMRALQRTLYLDPDHVLAHFTLGSLGLREGSRSARKHFTLALSRLEAHAPAEVIQGSGGLSARELRALISSMAASA